MKIIDRTRVAEPDQFPHLAMSFALDPSRRACHGSAMRSRVAHGATRFLLACVVALVMARPGHAASPVNPDSAEKPPAEKHPHHKRGRDGQEAARPGQHSGKTPEKVAVPAAKAPAAAPPVAVVPPAPAAPKPPPPKEATEPPAKLPRFAALKTDDTNMRKGPGQRYPIEWVYKRRDLPMEVEREYDVWRYVRDPDGVEGWVHQVTLSDRRTFMITDKDATLRAGANDTASPVAVLKVGVIGRLRECDEGSKWCQVQVAGYKGYLRRDQFWGLLPDEVLAPS